MKKKNFDRYLETQMQDPAFAARIERAGETWVVVLETDSPSKADVLAESPVTCRIKRKAA